MSIRRLRNDEPIPSGQPRRHYDAHGYVYLRWRVGERQYVEILEHRFVAGRATAIVHHKNGVKDDNRPENLQPMDSLSHGSAHSKIDVQQAIQLYQEGWSLPKLAKLYAVHHSTVLRVLRRRGVVFRTLKRAWMQRRNDFGPTGFITHRWNQ